MNDAACAPGQNGYPSDCELTEALRERARRHEQPLVRSAQWRAALPRAAKVELLLLDVDGVLTDGTIVYGSEEGESKGFSTQDGFGLRLLQEAGIAVGLITARDSLAVARRASDLKLRYLYQGRGDKRQAYEEILRESNLRPPQTAYMGDDWLDLPLLGLAGLAAAPANGVPEVRQRVHYVCERQGGHGAVRELCDLILEAKGRLAQLFAAYLSR